MTDERLWGHLFPIQEEDRNDPILWESAMRVAIRMFREEYPDLKFKEAHEDLIWDPIQDLWQLRVTVTYDNPE